MSAFRAFLRRFWRLGDVEIPIGTPWFVVYWPVFTRVSLWPICWQGWAAFIGLLIWVLGSLTVFILIGWGPGNLLFYVWLMPTIVIWGGLVAAKTEVRSK